MVEQEEDDWSSDNSDFLEDFLQGMSPFAHEFYRENYQPDPSNLSPDGVSLLQDYVMSSKSGKASLVRRAIRLGCSPNHKAHNGMSVLAYACVADRPRLEVVQILLQENASANSAGTLAGNLASTPDAFKFFELFKSRNYDFACVDTLNQTILFKAGFQMLYKQKANLDILLMLHQWGACLNAVDKFDMTFVDYLVSNDHRLRKVRQTVLEWLPPLVSHGFDITLLKPATLHALGCDTVLSIYCKEVC